MTMTTSNTTIRDLAETGSEMGEQDGELFKTALHALASPQSGDVGSEQCLEFVAAQCYESVPYATTETAREYVDRFVNVFDLEDLGDVNDLLGREAHTKENYRGQLAFVE